MAHEVGGTTPASESLGYKTVVSDCACVERGGISKMNRECVPRDARNFCQHRHHLFCKVRVHYEETPSVGAFAIEAPKGTLEELLGRRADEQSQSECP